jgi:plasmid segregation protein ParM
MIIGIDLGNYAVKTSTGITFPSKASKVGNILKNTTITIDGDIYHIGEGSLDTEYRKIKKQILRPLFYYALSFAQNCSFRVVTGLPVSQYRQDKDTLRELLMERHIVAVNGAQKRITIEDVAVYPEGLAAVYGMDFEGVLIDIGGRTTDCCEIINGKVKNPFSLPKGTINLNSDFVKVFNSSGLDLRSEDADRIIRKGLNVDGIPVDISPGMEVFRQFVDDLVSRLQIEYSIRTRDVLLIGGGGELLNRAIKNRIPAARMISNPVFANAEGFEKVGRDLWP